MKLIFRETDGITGDRLTFGDGPIDDGDYLKRDGRKIVGDDGLGGGGNLVYGGIYVVGNVVQTAIAIAGKINKVQVVVFSSNGINNNTTPDHTNDHIIIDEAGDYFVSVNIHADSIAGLGAKFGWSIYANNGTIEKINLHAHEDFGGGGGETKSIPLSGGTTFAIDDTVELWVWNETNTQNIIHTDIDMTLFKLGD